MKPLPFKITPYWDDDVNDYIETTLAQAKIVRLPNKNYLFKVADKAIAYVPPLAINDDQNTLDLWRTFFKRAFLEVCSEFQSPKIIVCPCMVNSGYWITLIIEITSTEPAVKIYDPTYNYESLSVTLNGLPSKIIPEECPTQKSVQFLYSSKRYAMHETGVVAAEYIAQFMLTAFPPDIHEDAETLRAKQIELMATLPLCENEKHYTRTNFLARNTTLTRSIVLNRFLEKCTLLSLDYSETAFILVQHLIPQTLELIKALVMDCGALPSNIFLLGKLYSTESWTLQQLRRTGINLIETHVSAYVDHHKFSDIFLADLLRLMEQFKEKICTAKSTIKKILILDDGGRCITQFMTDYSPAESSAPSLETEKTLKEICRKLLDYFYKHNIQIAAAEQTSAGGEIESGSLVSEGKVLAFPVVMMASSVAKKMFEPILISGQLWEKLQNIIFVKIPLMESSSDSAAVPPINIGVIGYGKIGKAVIRKIMTKKNVRLFIYDSDPTTAEVVKNFAIFCSTLEDLVAQSRYVIGCTGKDVFADRTLENLHITGHVTFISCSSENKEFFALIRWLKETSRLITQTDTDPLGTIRAKINGYQIEFLYGGCPFNFSGYTPGVYFQDIQSTLCLLFGALLQAHFLAGPVDNICEGRGLARLVVYDPFIQQTIIQLSIQHIESLQRLFAMRNPSTTVDLEDLKFLQETLSYLATTGITALSVYEFSQRGVNTEESQKVPLGSEWRIPSIETTFAVASFKNSCEEWLRILAGNYPQPIEKIAAAEAQEVIPVKDALEIEIDPSSVKISLYNAGSSAGPEFFPTASRPKKIIISLSALPSMAAEAATAIEIIADPKHLHPEKVHFWTTSKYTILSLTELAPYVNDILRQIERTQLRTEFPPNTLVLMMEILIRFCSFYYRMGCISPAISLITYAEWLINKIKQDPLYFSTVEIHQQLERQARAIAEIHWFNIYSLKYEYERCGIALDQVITQVLGEKKTVTNVLAEKKEVISKFVGRLTCDSWSACEKLAAWHNANGEFCKATEFYLQAIKQIREDIRQLESTSNFKDNAKAGAYKYYLANIQLALGTLYLEDGKEHAELGLLFHQVEERYKIIISKDLSLDEALVVWKLGNLCAKLGDKTKAEQYLQSSLGILRALGLERLNSIFVTQIQQDIGNLDKLLFPSVSLSPK